ncbi:globin family protein [Bacteriovorax sp. DB6_IX]|uniref:globin family protein n=1 Tax=Bacteriovorax sp. DB6_IX TaxID=1353530 RepID=UPI000389F996|nr:globin family protein [Bacteriovorax sp. DB6_IX]EQC50417.1 globin [Bacteriovorax sp. DB6_IX]
MSLDIQIIRDSFAQAKPIADQVADKFYEFLFTDYPAAKPLFENVNMESQKKQLMGGLSKIVDLLDQPEALTKYLKSSGQRHVKYGTKEEHYPLVGNTLIKTFAHFFGDAWTPELQQQWLMAYEFIANTMLQGAKEFTPSPVDIQTKIQSVCHKLIEEQMDTIIDDTIRARIRERVRQEIYQAIDEEFQALHLKKAA